MLPKICCYDPIPYDNVNKYEDKNNFEILENGKSRNRKLDLISLLRV